MLSLYNTKIIIFSCSMKTENFVYFEFFLLVGCNYVNLGQSLESWLRHENALIN